MRGGTHLRVGVRHEHDANAVLRLRRQRLKPPHRAGTGNVDVERGSRAIAKAGEGSAQPRRRYPRQQQQRGRRGEDGAAAHPAPNLLLFMLALWGLMSPTHRE